MKFIINETKLRRQLLVLVAVIDEVVVEVFANIKIKHKLTLNCN